MRGHGDDLFIGRVEQQAGELALDVREPGFGAISSADGLQTSEAYGAVRGDKGAGDVGDLPRRFQNAKPPPLGLQILNYLVAVFGQGSIGQSEADDDEIDGRPGGGKRRYPAALAGAVQANPARPCAGQPTGFNDRRRSVLGEDVEVLGVVTLRSA